MCYSLTVWVHPLILCTRYPQSNFIFVLPQATLLCRVQLQLEPLCANWCELIVIPTLNFCIVDIRKIYCTRASNLLSHLGVPPRLRPGHFPPGCPLIGCFFHSAKFVLLSIRPSLFSRRHLYCWHWHFLRCYQCFWESNSKFHLIYLFLIFFAHAHADSALSSMRDVGSDAEWIRFVLSSSRFLID